LGRQLPARFRDRDVRIEPTAEGYRMGDVTFDDIEGLFAEHLDDDAHLVWWEQFETRPFGFGYRG